MKKVIYTLCAYNCKLKIFITVYHFNWNQVSIGMLILYDISNTKVPVLICQQKENITCIYNLEWMRMINIYIE